jgi:CheY-like chemotaxis protein
METRKILIAEDDKITRMRYDRALDDPQLEKEFALDGEKALELYKTWAPDIMVLDIMLPTLSGYAVLKHIRQEGDQNTVIIMATSMAHPADIRDCFSLGIQGYIVKPIDFSTVQQRILSIYSNQQTTAPPQQ